MSCIRYECELNNDFASRNMVLAIYKHTKDLARGLTWVTTLAAEPADLSLSLRTHMVGEN